MEKTAPKRSRERLSEEQDRQSLAPARSFILLADDLDRYHRKDLC